MRLDTQALTASAMAGASTGARSFTALGALVVTAPDDATSQPDRALSHRAVKAVVGLVAVQELVMDKLPKTPSRLEVLGLCTRLAGAAASGVIIARRRAAAQKAVSAAVSDVSEHGPSRTTQVDDGPLPVLACAGVAAASAAATAWGGVKWRGWCTKVTRHDWVGASIEDAATIGLAAGAVRAIG